MRKSNRGDDTDNVNVTLGAPQTVRDDLQGKVFPCPLCGAGLPLLFSKRNKPYCTCNLCGNQLFFRGKAGIARLRKMTNDGILVSGTEEGATHGIALFNRLQQLRLQKKELEAKRGFILRYSSLENAIEIVDAEIESVQGELARMARTKKRELNK